MRRSRLLFAFPFGKGVVLRKAAFSYRKPSPLGKGDRAAVDRVLSLIVDLRRISSPSFIPLVPYPARSARHLPHVGKALSVGILFPHIRVFILTMREKRHPRFAAFPIGEGFVRRYCFSTHACIRSDNARKAVSPFRSLPHWGRGTAPAVDRVLS